jgi:ABC-2 type transport system permease protein
MTAFALAGAHARAGLLQLWRVPSYVVPTVLFPAMFFLIFDLPYARSRAGVAAYATLAFMAFAIVGVALYQFGVGIAQDRGRPWERYIRTLPVRPAARFAARAAAAMVFGLLAAGVIAVVSRSLTPIDLTLVQWLRAFVYAIAGAIPFVLIGITIGYWCAPRASVPVATTCNLLLAFAGGLWMPPQYLPHVVQQISPYLPTRQYADLLWSVVDGANVWPAVAGLALYTLLFFVLASIGYRRDERKRYA